MLLGGRGDLAVAPQELEVCQSWCADVVLGPFDELPSAITAICLGCRELRCIFSGISIKEFLRFPLTS